jgi:hypothetical protein
VAFLAGAGFGGLDGVSPRLGRLLCGPPAANPPVGFAHALTQVFHIRSRLPRLPEREDRLLAAWYT